MKGKTRIIKTWRDLVDFIDEVLNEQYAPSLSAFVTVPDGTEINTDFGYVFDFWTQLKEWLQKKAEKERREFEDKDFRDGYEAGMYEFRKYAESVIQLLAEKGAYDLNDLDDDELLELVTIYGRGYMKALKEIQETVKMMERRAYEGHGSDGICVGSADGDQPKKEAEEC